MATLIQFDAGTTAVLIDVTPMSGGVQAAGALDAVVKKAEVSFDEALKVAGSVARSFQRVVDEFGIQQAELEVGFQFTGKGTIYLVQSEAQAALKVKITFEKKAPVPLS